MLAHLRWASSLSETSVLSPLQAQSITFPVQIANTYFGWGLDRTTIVVSSGLAKAAQIHTATGHSVAVAFTADNLENVVGIMRARYRQARVVLATGFLSLRGTEQVNAVASPALPTPLLATPRVHRRTVLKRFRISWLRRGSSAGSSASD